MTSATLTSIEHCIPHQSDATHLLNPSPCTRIRRCIWRMLRTLLQSRVLQLTRKSRIRVVWNQHRTCTRCHRSTLPTSPRKILLSGPAHARLFTTPSRASSTGFTSPFSAEKSIHYPRTSCAVTMLYHKGFPRLIYNREGPSLNRWGALLRVD